MPPSGSQPMLPLFPRRLPPRQDFYDRTMLLLPMASTPLTLTECMILVGSFLVVVLLVAGVLVVMITTTTWGVEPFI